MQLVGKHLTCRPDEATYLEQLVDRPERHQAVWEVIRGARVAWANHVVPLLPVDVPEQAKTTPELSFAYRFAQAAYHWEPFADLVPEPLSIELAEEDVALIKELADVALVTALHQVAFVDETFAEFEAAIDPANRAEVQEIHDEYGITDETIKSQIFSQALDEIQMAHAIIFAITGTIQI